LIAILCFSFLAPLGRQPVAHEIQNNDAGKPPVILDAATVSSALDVFQEALNERWSYREAINSEFDSSIDALRKRAAAGMSVDYLGIELQKIIALGIDGHSRVSGYRLPPGGCLPFLIETAGTRFIAFTADRKAFLAPDFPFITKIDGRDLIEWCRTAAELVPQGSPQYIRHRALILLREIDYWRTRMKLPKRETVEVELTNSEGKEHKLLSLPVGKVPLAYGVWPKGGSRLLEGKIGYLRLPTMSEDSSAPEIKQWMPKFRDTTGLIVDVRDNNGGERAALILLYSYFAAPSDRPRVFTAAAYRLNSAHAENYLAENHHMFRVNDPHWTAEEREAVAAFARTFKPEWQPPEGKFSGWHFMALTRLNERYIYHYDKPVIVLMNQKCFSATDIFLAGLKGMKNVTLLGTTSSGGSAYSQEIVLGNTPLRVRIGTMASFQADGKLFDTRGVLPDIQMEPTPEYYIAGRDNFLEAAIRQIKEKGKILGKRSS
jgi:hypothetical protein